MDYKQITIDDIQLSNETIYIENAGNIEINNVNCRCRTALRTLNNEIIYLEFCSALPNKKVNHEWIIINHLFKIDDINSKKETHDYNLYETYIKKYYESYIPYTVENVKELLKSLNVAFNEIIFTDWNTYHVHANNKYNLGN